MGKFVLVILLTLISTGLGKVDYDPANTDEYDEIEVSQEKQDDAGEAPITPTAEEDDCPLLIKVVRSKGSLTICGNKTRKFLQYQSYDERDMYPPWSYRGLIGPKEWHKIDPQVFNTNYRPDIAPSMHKKYSTEETATDASSSNYTQSTNGSATQANETDYYGNVPSFMRFGGNLPENFCDGPMPSPIVIEPSEAKVQDSLTEFELLNMDKNYTIQMYFPEDGTDLLTVRMVDTWGDTAPCISKGSLIGADLCFDRMFIHYGTDGVTGSEHRFENTTYAMELQLFFTLQEDNYRKVKEFFYVYLNDYVKSGPSDKFNIKGKLVQAIAVFVEVIDGETTNSGLKILADMAKAFWSSSNEEKMRSFTTRKSIFNFEDIFPKSVYYTYRGSLTFPPCFPDLDWTVFETPLKMSREDFESFLFIPSEFDETGFVAGNFRPIKDIYVQLEDRLVNRDEGSRLQAAQARKYRPLFKSLPPEKKGKDAMYDYYDGGDNAGERLVRPNIISLTIVLLCICLSSVVVSFFMGT